MAMHNYELAQICPKKLAASVLFVGLRILERVDKSLSTDSIIRKVCDLFSMSYDEVKGEAKLVLDFAKKFERVHPNLKNLRTLYNEEFKNLKRQ